MKNDLKPKLIAVIDLNKLRLFKAQGIKIIEKLEEMPLDIHKEFSHERGSYKNASGPTSAFEPHTTEEDYKYQETAHVVAQHISQVFNGKNEYGELMLSAPAKLLGHVRQELNSKIKQTITKELSKDLAHKTKDEIEKLFFS